MKLEVRQGSFFYRTDEPLFRNVSFCLEDGEILTILGPNGVGKTTLIKCIMGLCRWKEGNAFFNGAPLVSIDKTSGISFVPQAHSTTFDFTVEQMVSMGCARTVSLFGSPKKEENQQVIRAMETVGILPLRNRLCSHLSGGQRQLTYIARALVSEPQLMILDEPESHLDFKNQLMVLQLIEQLNHQGMSFIVNTHYPDHALRISQKALLLGHDGFVFGETDHVISEEHVKQYFDVDAKILKVPGKTRMAHAFVVVD